MSRPARSGWCACALALVLATSCGGNDPRASETAQILAASRAPWNALNKGDGPSFCDAVTPQLWAEVLGIRAAAASSTAANRCARATAQQISSGRLAWVASAMLKEQEARQLIALTLSGAHATLRFRGSTITVRKNDLSGPRNMASGLEAATITVPKQELVEIDLLRGDDRRWRVAGIKATERAGLSALSASGFSETFYAYLSSTSNNGSAFAGYTGYIQPDRSHVDFLAEVLGLTTGLRSRR